MTPSDLDALLEDVEAAQARIDAGTANMGEYDALSDAAPLLAAEVKRLRAEVEEARLTLAAEQGRQEGAPSNLWRWDPYRHCWERNEPRGVTGVVSPCGGNAGAHGWSIETRGQRLDREPTARAAMQAADKASP